jgi:HupE / UreJ protein
MSPLRFLASLFVLVFAGIVQAHPIPDVPVRSFFEAGGACRIVIEVDPRCFNSDPDIAPSLLFKELKTKPAAEQQALVDAASTYVAKTIEFLFEPLGRIAPEFKFAWTGHGGVTLQGDEDVSVLTGTWQTTVPAGLQGYRIRATPEGKVSVLFLNHLGGEAVERTAVLFPGETSFLLDLTALSASMPEGPNAGAVGVSGGRWATFGDFFQQGFLHVLPLGLDHILFVLFLLARAWRPLLWQVTTFTAAHTFTLGLATFGWVQVSPKIVEPVIAFSLVFVAMENILRPRYSAWRLVVVFVFGLVHGLGFAGALRELELPIKSLLVGLLGFNVGVEAGQLAVVGIAALATAWLRDPALYRRAIVIPGSAAIAVMGLWWTVTRVFGE